MNVCKVASRIRLPQCCVRSVIDGRATPQPNTPIPHCVSATYSHISVKK